MKIVKVTPTCRYCGSEMKKCYVCGDHFYSCTNDKCRASSPFRNTADDAYADAMTPEPLQRMIKSLNNYICKLERAMLLSDDPQVCCFDFTTAWNESKIETEREELKDEDCNT